MNNNNNNNNNSSNNENKIKKKKNRLLSYFLKSKMKPSPVYSFQGAIASYAPTTQPVIRRRRIIKTRGELHPTTIPTTTTVHEEQEEIIEEEEEETTAGEQDLELTQKDIEQLNEIEKKRLLKAKWYHFLGLHDNFSSIWMASLMEFIGTAVFTFMSCAIVVSSVNYFDIDPIVTGSFANYKPIVMIGVFHVPLLFFMIMATAPASGAHLNSTITIATLFARMTSLIRAIMYIIAQTSGGILGAAILRGILRFSILKKTNLGMCVYDNEVSAGDALGAEFMFSCLMLIIAFGTALNPKARAALGPMTGAFFISITTGLCIIITGGLSDRYTFGFNITRCLAPAIVMGDLTMIWPFIVGPLLACMCVGVWVWFYPDVRYFSNLASLESLEGCENKPMKRDIEEVISSTRSLRSSSASSAHSNNSNLNNNNNNNNTNNNNMNSENSNFFIEMKELQNNKKQE